MTSKKKSAYPTRQNYPTTPLVSISLKDFCVNWTTVIEKLIDIDFSVITLKYYIDIKKSVDLPVISLRVILIVPRLEPGPHLLHLGADVTR